MPFRVIIAGSRNFNDYEFLKEKCDAILSKIDDEIWIISGTAKGADQLGEKYAQEKGYYLLEVPAYWDKIEGKPYKEIGTTTTGKPYWKLAGHERNERMAKNSDALIAFDMGTPGTKDMIQRAKNHGLKIRTIKR
jgi:hypothetical protein